MVSGRSPPFGYILEKVKSNNDLVYYRGFGKGSCLDLPKYNFVVFVHLFI